MINAFTSKNARLLFACMLLAFFLFACSQENQLTDDSNFTLDVSDTTADARPDVPRSNNYSDEEPLPEGEEIIEPDTRPIFLERHESKTQFIMPIGTSIYEVIGVIGQEELPLLRPAPVRSGDGHIRGYRQYVTFGPNNTGNITFLADGRDDEYVGPTLFFEEDKTLLRYELILNNGVFFDNAVIGSDISILGVTYRVMEATNETLILNGVDTPQYLRLLDGETLRTNNKVISDSHVQYNGRGFTISFAAPDVDENGLWLKNEELLSSALEEAHKEEVLFSQYFDMRFDGLQEMPLVPVTFKVRDTSIDLLWGNNRVPILGINDEGKLWHGEQKQLHLKECERSNKACIYEEDLMIFEGRALDERGRPGPVLSEVMRLSGIDSEEGKLIFRDSNSQRLSVDWEGTPGLTTTAVAILPFLDREYKIYVMNSSINMTLPNGTIVETQITDRVAIDLNGDGRVAGDDLGILLAENIRLQFENPLDTTEGIDNLTYTLNMTLETTPFTGRQTRSRTGILSKEQLSLQATAHERWGFSITVPEIDTSKRDTQLWDQTLIEGPEDDYAFGLSLWGSEIILELDSNSLQTTSDELQLLIPQEQRMGIISIGTLFEKE